MPSVLIVDDDSSVSGMYSYIFKRRGFTVHLARDSMEGLQALAVTKPDAVVLDLLMPGENGVEFLERADMKHKLPNTKVFVVTNAPGDEFAKQLEPFGLEAYATKAEKTPNQVVEMVERSLAREAGSLRVSWLARLLGRR